MNSFLPVSGVVLGLIGLALTLLSPRRAQLTAGLVLGAILACSILGYWIGPVATNLGGWAESINIRFEGDKMSFFALAVATLILLFLVAFESGEENIPLWLGLLAGFSGALMTRDFFNLFVWFEVSMISTFGLLRLELGPNRGTLRSYLTVQILGSTAMLLGAGAYYAAFGTLSMSPRMVPTSIGLVATLLMALAMAVKSGLPPFHGWVIPAYRRLTSLSALPILMLSSKVGLIGFTRITGHLPAIWPLILGTIAFYGSSIVFQPLPLRLRVFILHTAGLAMLIGNPDAFGWGLVHSILASAMLVLVQPKMRSFADWLGVGVIVSLPLTPGFSAKIGSIPRLADSQNFPLVVGLLSTSVATLACGLIWVSRTSKLKQEPSPILLCAVALTLLLGIISSGSIHWPEVLAGGGTR